MRFALSFAAALMWLTASAIAAEYTDEQSNALGIAAIAQKADECPSLSVNQDAVEAYLSGAGLDSSDYDSDEFAKLEGIVLATFGEVGMDEFCTIAAEAYGHGGKVVSGLLQ